MYDRFLSAYLVMNANAVSSPAHINAYVYFLNLPMNVTQQVYTVIYFRMSQKKKLAVYKHQVGYWKRQGDRREFIALTNFNLELLKFVEAPPSLPTYKGYIAKIMQLGRKHRLYEGYVWLSYIMHVCHFACHFRCLLSLQFIRFRYNNV